MLRCHVVYAVFKRNLLSYFTGVLGYLFIVVFVVAGAYLAFNARFFTNNLANLDELSRWFPMLLLFIVPAVTMSTWADERKLGTDELLFTLPASDVEILLGKYLAVLAVYTVTLLFSVTHLGVLGWYADPDWGLLFATYFGYWIAGAALLSAGMFASVLTSSTTVAFVLGAAICAIPVFIAKIAPTSEFFRELSLNEQFREFGMGMLPLSGVLYFVSLTLFMLYLNLVFISKRHWSSSQQTSMGMQFVVRTVSLAAILISLNALASYGTVRLDLTSEKLYTLSDTTRDLIDKIDDKRPVTIQAFLSPDVPREYVPIRKRLIGLLRQYDHLGGGLIDVRYVDVKPFSKEAEEAKLFGIKPVRIRSERDGRRIEEDVFLGAVVSSTLDEVVIPFIGAGTPVEYELTRSVRTVSSEQRLTVGILRTDADVIGSSREWQIVTELKQQYNVEEIFPDSEIDENKFHVVMAVLPSSLTEPQMANLVDYVKKGKPALIFDDPFPMVFNSMYGVSNAPRQPKPSPGGGMMGMQRQPPVPKADGGKATSLLNVMKIAWEYDQVAFDYFNPHPEFFAVVPPEYLFISPQSGVKSAFGTKSDITSGLQEMLAAYCGTIRPRAGSDLKFEPLLRTGRNSGLLNWDEFTSESFNPMRMAMTAQLAPNPRRDDKVDEYAHVLAAHITGNRKTKLNVVYVADLDLISDWFFYERSRGESNLKLDNVTFVLNAVDVLAGDEAYLNLRKRRATHRTLAEVEKQNAQFIKKRNEGQEAADKAAKTALEDAKGRFREKLNAIRDDETLDERAKAEQLRMWEELEERRIAVAEANIERDKQSEIEKIKAETERSIQEREDQLRIGAVTLSPMPAILLGVIILSMRVYNERRDITPDRLVER